MSELKSIGRVISLNDRVDPNGIINKYIRKQMRVVDLIPVKYLLDTTKVQQGVPSQCIKYEFDQEIEDYMSDCADYGLEEYAGVRCYITDDTSMVEDIENQYEESPIRTILTELSQTNRIVRALAGIRGLSRTILQSADPLMASSNPEKLPKEYDDIFKQNIFGNSSIDVSNSLMTLLRTARNVVLLGKNVSLPKVWSDSSYSPSMQLNIRLVSPYGSPSAISKYVIEPLIYLLILAAPRTNDGISYGWPRYVHVKYYGGVYIPCAYISSISIRRGGSDTVYSIYRQPLCVDVTLSISPIATGFAVFGGPDSEGEGIDISEVEEPIDSSDILEAPPSAIIPTVGTVIRSFRPVILEDSEEEEEDLSYQDQRSSNNPSSNLNDNYSIPINENPTTIDSFMRFVTNPNTYNWKFDPSKGVIIRPSIPGIDNLTGYIEDQFSNAYNIYLRSLTDIELKRLIENQR
ncbi:MAG: hypothetical protein QXD03_03680 [Candidatus Anstonellales archaeon]